MKKIFCILLCMTALSQTTIQSCQDNKTILQRMLGCCCLRKKQKQQTDKVTYNIAPLNVTNKKHLADIINICTTHQHLLLNLDENPQDAINTIIKYTAPEKSKSSGMRHIIQNNPAHIKIATTENNPSTVVGYTIYRAIQDDLIRIGHIAVAKKHQKQGVGSLLLSSIYKEKAITTSLGACIYNFNIQGTAFFEKHGFTAFAETEDPFYTQDKRGKLYSGTLLLYKKE